MHTELLLLKPDLKCGIESQEGSKCCKTSTSQSRHCKHKTPKWRNIKGFRPSKRWLFPIPTAASRYGIKVKWWSVSLQITGTWSTVYTSCVIFRKIRALIHVLSNIYPDEYLSNLNIFTHSPTPDVTARGQYMQNLIIHVLCTTTHKRLFWLLEQVLQLFDLLNRATIILIPGVLCSAVSRVLFLRMREKPTK